MPQAAAAAAPGMRPVIELSGNGVGLFEGKNKAALEAFLPGYMRASRWFAGKARTPRVFRVIDVVPIPGKAAAGYLTLVRVEYAEGGPEIYAVPLSVARGVKAQDMAQAAPQGIVA